MISYDQLKFFDQEGYLELEKILSKQDIVFYSKTYDAFINNEFDTTDLRSDLSGKEDNDMEYITQIMLPSKIYPDLLDLSMHQKSLAIAQQLLGQDMILDFDMLINKAPHTNQPTPWHQDAAYWIDMQIKER